MEDRFANVAGSQAPQPSADDGLDGPKASLAPIIPALPNKLGSSHPHECVLLSLPADDPISSQILSRTEVSNGHRPPPTEPRQSVSEGRSMKHTESLSDSINPPLIVDPTVTQLFDLIQNEKHTRKQLANPSFRRLRDFLTDTWWSEALALAFSSCCIKTISGLLLKYDGHKTSDFPSGLTLNAIISVLAVGSRSTLIFAVAATMSKSKWHWFHTQHITVIKDVFKICRFLMVRLEDLSVLSLCYSKGPSYP